MSESTLVPDGEITEVTTYTGIIQYLMPVGFITELSQNTASADVDPDVSENG